VEPPPGNVLLSLHSGKCRLLRICLGDRAKGRNQDGFPLLAEQFLPITVLRLFFFSFGEARANATDEIRMDFQDELSGWIEQPGPNTSLHLERSVFSPCASPESPLHSKPKEAWTSFSQSRDLPLQGKPFGLPNSHKPVSLFICICVCIWLSACTEAGR